MPAQACPKGTATSIKQKTQGGWMMPAQACPKGNAGAGIRI